MQWARPFTSSLLICFLALRATAQDAGEIRFRTLSIDDGLSQSTVRAILRDHRGFMWFATQDGLDRYDGYAFTIFRHNDRDSLSLADNLVTCLLEDSRGTLWVGTYNGGVDCYDGRRGGFLHFRGRQKGPGALSVTCLAEDRAGRVWVGSWGAGLMVFDPPNGSWRYLRHDTADPSSLIHDQVSAIAIGQDGRLWVATWGGLDFCDPGVGRFAHLRHDASAASVSDNRLTSLVLDEQGMIWAGTFEQGLNRIDPRDNSVVRTVSAMPVPPSPQDRMLGPMARDGQGVLWIATRGAGVVRFDPRSGIALPLRHDDRDRTSLSANTVTAVYADPSGGIWVGTNGGGVNHFDPHRFKFGHLRHIPGDARSLASGDVRALAEDGLGSLWIGTMGEGLDRLDLHSGRISHFRRGAPNAAALSSDEVLGLLVDREGVLWIGTNGGGLDRYDPRTGSCKELRCIPTDTTTIGSDYVMALLQSRDGSLWIGTLGGGLARLDARTLRCTRYIRTPGDDRLSGNYIYSLLEDRAGFLWIGTWGAGLTVLDMQTGQWKSYRHSAADTGSLANNTVIDLFEDHTGTIWAATEGGGLNRFLPSSRTFRSVTEADGLPNNVVYGVLEDSSGRLWLSTNRGLCSYDPRSGGIRSFGTEDGLQSLEFNQGARCSGANGRMYFGGINGVNYFVPARLPVDTLAPPVRITAVRILNREVPFDQDEPVPLEVRYDENLVSFEFAALDYVAPGGHLFRYRLEGFDSDWRPPAQRHDASYTNLAGGDYVFHVQGSNSDGIWNRTGARIAIHVVPPFWQTVWFRTSAALILFVTGFGVYRERQRRLRRDREIQADFSRKLNASQEHERKRVAAALHDSLGQDLLTLRNRLLRARTLPQGNPELPEELRCMADDVQQTIDEVREIAADLHPHMLERLGLTKTIEAALRSAARSSGLQITASIDPVDRLFRPSDEINFFRIIQEGVTNVLKHSRASECHVTVRHDESWCEIRIADDGCGLPSGSHAGTLHEGFGMANMAERCRLLGGQMKASSTPGEGTTLLFTFPLPGKQQGAAYEDSRPDRR